MYLEKNSRKILRCRPILKRSCKILAALLAVHAIGLCLDYAYVDVSPTHRLLWHYYYEDRGKIDNLYIGSSHVYSDLNPAQLDYRNGQYNFNLSSPNQLLNGSYYLLREAAADNTLSHVYLELYYDCSAKDAFNENQDPVCLSENFNRNWQNTDFMEPSLNKLAYMLSIGGPESYGDILIPFIRYRSKLDDWEYVRSNIAKKREDTYRTYRYHLDLGERGYDEYLEQGYYFSTMEFPDENHLFLQTVILKEHPLGETSEYWLRKFITCCREKNLPLTLFVSPIHDLQLVSTQGYDCYVRQIRSLAEEYGLEFYDFNLVREEYLPIQDGRYFRDAGHLNNAGASLFTPFFYETVTSGALETKHCFYESYEEKLRETPPALYGLYYRDQENLRSYYIASNRQNGMEYRIIITPQDGEQYCLQDFDTNAQFRLPKDLRGVCTLVARMADTPDQVVHTMEIQF